MSRRHADPDFVGPAPVFDHDGRTLKVLFLPPLDGLNVFPWSPLPPGEGPSTQVHLMIEFKKGADGRTLDPFIMRLKSRRIVEELAAALLKHAAEVWPETAS